jgi:membrane magnesium transporter 1
LPLDIRVETLISTVLVCLGLVAGADRLKPISWNVWAGNIEREGGGANPYQGLEERAGFLDIRVCGAICQIFCDRTLTFLQAKRVEFANWVREQGSVPKS